jgi:hypothetical protein
VDRIDRIVALVAGEIEPTRGTTTGYLAAIGNVEGRLVSILSLAPLGGAA